MVLMTFLQIIGLGLNIAMKFVISRSLQTQVACTALTFPL